MFGNDFIFLKIIIFTFYCDLRFGMQVNKSQRFEKDVLLYDHIEASNLLPIVNDLTKLKLSDRDEIEWLLKAISLIDLTTLSADDTPVNVRRICLKAIHPLSSCLVDKLSQIEFDWDLQELTTAAVCVYPNQVKTCSETFAKLGILNFPIASGMFGELFYLFLLFPVATGFPSGQYPIGTRLDEIRSAIDDGATEIDIVINRTLALQGNWKGVYDEVYAMRQVCGHEVHLKTILATGELVSYDNVYKASMTCMLAGADFIKTSTGKESVNATLPVSLVMARAIRDFYKIFYVKVGFKPAGGLRTSEDAIDYLKLINQFLGSEWSSRDLLRFGASSLLGSIEARMYQLCHDSYPPLPGYLDYF